MRILSKPALREFWEKHPTAMAPLQEWWKSVKGQTWNNSADVKNTYHSADIYRDCFIFNIGGNNFRLIAKIDFKTQRLFVRSIMTHKEYDKGKWKDEC